MSSSTSGLKSHCSGWCGSKKNTGGAPMISSLPGTAVGVRDADRLRQDRGLERHPGRGRMVAVVRVGERVGQHDGRLHAAVDVDELVDQSRRLGSSG